MLSTMSRRRWAGFLEGMNGTGAGYYPEQRLEGPAVHHVAGAVENLVDVELQPRILEDPDGAVLIGSQKSISLSA